MYSDLLSRKLVILLNFGKLTNRNAEETITDTPVFPHPFRNLIQIYTSEQRPTKALQIMDLQGIVVYSKSKEISSANHVTGIKSSIYFSQVSHEEREIFSKTLI